MKKLFILLIALVAMNSAMAQWTSNCNVNEELLIYYEEDVKDMAVQWLFDIHSPDTGLIDIPQWSLDTIWAGLAALNNRCDLPEVDSVFNKYCVHIELGFVNIKHILVQLDSNCSWLNNWMNLQTNTGVADLDSLFSQYEFTLVDFFAWSFGNYGYLETTEMINLYAICDSLESFEGITYSEPDGWSGSSAWYDHIYFSDTAGVKYYSFQIGISLAGRYLWNFKVNLDCSIEFLGNKGSYWYDEFPEPNNCNIFTSEAEYIKESFNYLIYPNPFSTLTTLSYELKQPEKVTMSIYNHLGKLVYQTQENQSQGVQQLIWNAERFADGIYYYRLQVGDAVANGKMVKVR
jgi:hypothetical protein